MKLHFHVDRDGNFGDDLNRWMWDHFFPSGFFDRDDTVIFVGMGSLLGKGMASATSHAERRIVFGTGSGYQQPFPLDARWDIRFVRGPRTAAKFGLPSEKSLTDPAILLSQINTSDQGRDNSSPAGIAYMPHHSSLKFGDWSEICRLAKVDFIDPRDDGLRVMRKIAAAKLVISEAMHGAIAADALRVPWVPVKAYPSILEFKWYDWSESLDLGIEFAKLTPVYRSLSDYPVHVQLKNYAKLALSRFRLQRFDIVRPIFGSTQAEKERTAEDLRRIAETSSGYLSADGVFTAKVRQVLEEIDMLIRDYS